MTHPGKALGQNMEKPAPNELVGIKLENSTLAGAAAVPGEQDLSLGVVAQELFGMEGAALDVAREVSQGRLAASHVLDMTDPLLVGSEDLTGLETEVLEELRILLLQGQSHPVAEAVRQWVVVDEEVVLGGMNELARQFVVGHGRDDDVVVRMVLLLTAPGVKHRSEPGPATELGLDDILQCRSALGDDEVVEFFGMRQAERAQFLGHGEGHHEVGNRQKPCLLLRGPDLLVERPALGAAAMVATVVGVVPLSAAIAAIESASEFGATAREHAAHGPVMGRAQVRAIDVGEARPVLTQNVREAQGHDGWDFRVPVRVPVVS